MLALHHREGSFSDKWIEYCESNGIAYKLVNCYSSDIIDKVKDCEALMWHWTHSDHRASLFARQLTYSLELAGKRVFPSSATSWHFDDKVGQKYLLEAIGAPLVPSYVFFDKKEALHWASKTTYPKIFKLRGGAGAENVHLVRSFKEASRFIRQAFGKGFKAKNRVNFLKERFWQFKRDRTLSSFFNISKGIARLIIPHENERNFPAERYYAYFQDFIPGNDCDVRVVVVGKRAFAFKRMVRDGDFRASGSGKTIHDPDLIPEECLRLSFKIATTMNAQSLALDFIIDRGKPLVVEVSYAFARKGYLLCPGYWTDRMEWVDGSFYPEFFMIEDLIGKLNE